MAICDVCKREMTTADGCTAAYVFIVGKRHERIPNWENDRCYDCGAKFGEYHHWGCDNERCPVCGGQMIGCDCEDVYIEIKERDPGNL